MLRDQFAEGTQIRGQIEPKLWSRMWELFGGETEALSEIQSSALRTRIERIIFRETGALKNLSEQEIEALRPSLAKLSKQERETLRARIQAPFEKSLPVAMKAEHAVKLIRLLKTA